MAYLMTASEFVNKIENIRKNYKTVYMLGTVGQKCTQSVINSCASRLPSFYTQAKLNQLKPYIGNSWAFDCVGLIKAVLWNWSPNGANYAINGVPDINETTMLNSYCTGVSSDFSTIIPGEVVWLSGHIGVYIGNGLVVECTPKWSNNVQLSWLQNLSTNPNYNNRRWTKHGKLNWINYATSKTGWIQDKIGWWYKLSDGTYYRSCWQKIKGVWYYFDERGYAPQNKWLVYKGNKYYLTENCSMATGWMYIDRNWYYFDPVNGDMKKERIVEHKGKYYALDSDGKMITSSEITFPIDEEGVLHWKQS